MTTDSTSPATPGSPPFAVELVLRLPDELGGIWRTETLMLTVPRVGEQVGHGPAIFDVTGVIHYAVSDREHRAAQVDVAAREGGPGGPIYQYPWWLPGEGWRRMMEGVIPWEPSSRSE